MNSRFRRLCDEMLLRSFEELGVPYHVVGGTIAERLERVVGLFGLPTVMNVAEAIRLAEEDYALQDLRFETERVPADMSPASAN
jgi:hypothetical protein